MLFSFLILSSKSQDLSNFRTKTISYLTDSMILDTLSIVPNSEIILNNKNQRIKETLYTIDYAKSFLILTDSALKINKTLKLSYRVFPVNFTESYSHRNLDETIIIGPVLAYPLRIGNRHFHHVQFRYPARHE